MIRLAVRSRAILLTDDKDFGRLVYAAGLETTGVVLMRFPASARSALPAAVVNLVRTRGRALVGQFIVMQPGRVRIGS